MDRFINAHGLWTETGCFHRAAVYDPQKDNFIIRVEDIARHNCIDRTAGRAFLNKISIRDNILFVSARITASLLLKALNAGFRTIFSPSAVTSSAVSLAEEHEIAVLGCEKKIVSLFFQRVKYSRNDFNKENYNEDVRKISKQPKKLSH